MVRTVVVRQHSRETMRKRHSKVKKEFGRFGAKGDFIPGTHIRTPVQPTAPAINLPLPMRTASVEQACKCPEGVHIWDNHPVAHSLIRHLIAVRAVMPNENNGVDCTG